VEAVLNVLDDQDPQIRRIAVHTLRHAVHTNDAARAAVSLRLEDKDAKVRESAREILDAPAREPSR